MSGTTIDLIIRRKIEESGVNSHNRSLCSQ